MRSSPVCTAVLADLLAAEFDIAVGGVAATPGRLAANARFSPWPAGPLRDGKTLVYRCNETR